MELQVNGHKTFCYTGGKPFNPAQPTVVLIHGVLNDHSVWAMQSRYLANHGWNVLAVDLPGHCKSAGPAPASVEEAADFIIALLDAVGAPPTALGAGTWVYGASMALGRRVLRSNPEVNLFHRGFVACDSYAGGDAAIARITCPVLFALGTQDQMTTPKAAQALISTARAAGKGVQVVYLPVGHHQMTEAPEETLFALRDFLAR